MICTGRAAASGTTVSPKRAQVSAFRSMDPVSRYLRPGLPFISMLRAAAVAASLAVAAGLSSTALAARRPHRKPVPILMYHIVSAPPRGVPLAQLYVRPKDFSRQISWLARHRYHAVTLLRVYEYWTTGRRLPRRPIVISFDDGYLSQYTRAFPVLRAHHWPAVLNLEVRHLRPV